MSSKSMPPIRIAQKLCLGAGSGAQSFADWAYFRTGPILINGCLVREESIGSGGSPTRSGMRAVEGAHAEGDVAGILLHRRRLGFAAFLRRNQRRIPTNTGNSNLTLVNLDCPSTVMSRPYAQHPPNRSRRARIEGCRVPVRVRHLLAPDEGFDYVEPRCRVCTSEFRECIEDWTIAGARYSVIAKQTPPDRLGRRLDRRSVSRHHKRHMPR